MTHASDSYTSLRQGDSSNAAVLAVNRISREVDMLATGIVRTYTLKLASS